MAISGGFRGDAVIPGSDGLPKRCLGDRQDTMETIRPSPARCGALAWPLHHKGQYSISRSIPRMQDEMKPDSLSLLTILLARAHLKNNRTLQQSRLDECIKPKTHRLVLLVCNDLPRATTSRRDAKESVASFQTPLAHLLKPSLYLAEPQ